MRVHVALTPGAFPDLALAGRSALVVDVLRRTGALDYTRRCAERESDAAAASVDDLPDSPYRKSLLELATFAARRTY